jgi:AraC family transcriptional regulator
MKSEIDTPSSPLKHIMGSSDVLMSSSASQSVDELIVERYRISPGERKETTASQHVLRLWTRLYSGEYASNGGFVKSSKPAGTLTLTPAGIIPTIRTHISSEVIVCALEPSLIERTLLEGDRRPTMEHIIRPKFQDPAIARLMTLLMEDLEAGSISGKLYRESLSVALAARYISLGADNRQSATQYSKTKPLPTPVLRRVLDLIEESLGADLNLSLLAIEAGYSRAHFAKMFRESMGISPHRYLLTRRIEYARSLLRRNDSLIDIATMCGFSSQAHLTRIFREHTGLTPGSFRRRINLGTLCGVE